MKTKKTQQTAPSSPATRTCCGVYTRHMRKLEESFPFPLFMAYHLGDCTSGNLGDTKPNPGSMLALHPSHREPNLAGRTGSRGCWIFGAGAPLLLNKKPRRAPAVLENNPLLRSSRYFVWFVGVFFKQVLPVLLPLMSSINHWKKRKQHRASSFAHRPAFFFFLSGMQKGKHFPFGIC